MVTKVDALMTCRDPIKGVKALIASGTVEDSPEVIAAFLHQHNASLDKEQLGEYLGHHNDLEVRWQMALN